MRCTAAWGPRLSELPSWRLGWEHSGVQEQESGDGIFGRVFGKVFGKVFWGGAWENVWEGVWEGPGKVFGEGI